jgi:hypothetical protein
MPEVKGFKVHNLDVSEVMFHPEDSRRVLSCSEDTTAWYVSQFFFSLDQLSQGSD